MNLQSITKISAAIHFIETYLTEKIDLERVAEAIHYAKHHLHRVSLILWGSSSMTMIIHGVAGSAKASIALHRIAFLPIKAILSKSDLS